MVLSKKRARHVIEEIIALFPDAKPSLDFRNHFELLVAVKLRRQTRLLTKRHQVCLRLFQPRKPWQQPVKPISPSIFLN